MKKKTFTSATFISLLLLSLTLGALFVNRGKANPYYNGGNTPPPADAKPPAISIFNPKNNTVFDSNNISLAFKVTMSKSTYMINTVWFEVDWQEGNTTVYSYWSTPYYQNKQITEFSRNKTLTGIPEGKHNIKVIASAHGTYVKGLTGYHFDIGGSSSVKFTIDTKPPKISVLSIQNTTYDINDIDLNFTISESVSQIAYSLDGQENVTIAGNSTLTNLTYVDHNVTVYAIDSAGNTGASETITFTLAKPPKPLVIAPVATASVATVAVVGVGLMVYFRKRKR